MSVTKKFRAKFRNEQKAEEAGEKPVSQPKAKSILRGERRSWEREGAWRVDDKGEYWWFEGDQLDDLDDINRSIDDDLEFWKAFNEYVKDNKVSKSRTSKDTFWREESERGKYKWSDDMYGDSGSMSSYWNPWSKKGTKWSGDLDTRVALAMRAVTTTVQIIDDSGSRMTVTPSQEFDRTVAFTDFERGRIVISAKPIGDDKIKEGEAIDIMTGYGLHEASHSKYTRPVWDSVTKSELKPKGVTGMLANLAEDVRIERLTSEDFPGFAGYFDKSNEYVAKERNQPKAYGPDITSKLNAAIGIVKWPTETEPIAMKGYPSEWKWWREWIEAFKPDASNLYERVETAIAHLRAATEEEEEKGEDKPDKSSDTGKGGKAADEMDEQAEREEQAQQAMEQAMKDFMERKDIDKFCAHDEDALEGMDADHVQRLYDEELQKEDIEVKTPNGSASAPVYVSRPMENAESRRFFDKRVDPSLNLYKSALILRPVDPHWSIKLQREGEIDDDEIWRWATDDWRVFEERKIPHDPKARIGLLVDISGSMHGQKLNAAVKMARLFIEALTSIHGVTPYVWAHTGDINEEGSNVYRIWEPGDDKSRLGLLHSLEHGNNYDGHAIAYVTKELAGRSMPDEQKMLIVLSDGLPSGALGYGGVDGQQHVRIAVDDAQKAKDIRVLQIAIDTSVDEARQRRMFDEFIPFKPGDSLDSVPKRMTRWLEKAL